MKGELLKRLAMIGDIGDVRGARVIPDARDISHYKDILKGIWWYHLASGKLEYSTKAKSHFDGAFTNSVPTNVRGWIRGRVGDLDGKLYAFVYTGDFPGNRVPGVALSDIFRKLLAASGLDIEHFVDEEGYDIVEIARF